MPRASELDAALKAQFSGELAVSRTRASAEPDGVFTVIEGAPRAVWHTCGGCKKEAAECMRCREHFSPGERIRCPEHAHERCPVVGKRDY